MHVSSVCLFRLLCAGHAPQLGASGPMDGRIRHAAEIQTNTRLVTSHDKDFRDEIRNGCGCFALLRSRCTRCRPKR